ncbi:uncharacterized protein LOC130702423 [Daphnia carinata]|uniref:uncharacterized protein LOC130702423 n=1 Tax=Daphnia carinata TaxID=120202 RepID=UPI00257BD57D|nr:uncharacterized protein LOC130702423 [Daphnia carinata]
MQDANCCPVKIPSISDRLQLLFENPLHIQELIFKEKCQPLRQAIDLKYTLDLPVQNNVIQNQYKIVRIERLLSSYRSGELHLRVIGTRIRPMVFAVPLDDTRDFSFMSRDAYATLLQDWESAPPVVIEVFNSPFTFDHGSRYCILVYDLIVRGWELVGCLSPLISDKMDTRHVPDPAIRLMEYFRKNLPHCSKQNLTNVTKFTTMRKPLEQNVGRRNCRTLPVANCPSDSQSF